VIEFLFIGGFSPGRERAGSYLPNNSSEKQESKQEYHSINRYFCLKWLHKAEMKKTGWGERGTGAYKFVPGAGLVLLNWRRVAACEKNIDR